MEFSTAGLRILLSEGAYVNNPKDPGGETNLGITWPFLHQAIGAGIVPAETQIKTLTREQALLIYQKLVWDVLHPESLPSALIFQLFDWAVNSGISAAVHGLQRALRLADDGRIGPATLVAVKAAEPHCLMFDFMAERMDFLRKCKGWDTFGNGWSGRFANNLRYAARDFQ